MKIKKYTDVNKFINCNSNKQRFIAYTGKENPTMVGLSRAINLTQKFPDSSIAHISKSFLHMKKCINETVNILKELKIKFIFNKCDNTIKLIDLSGVLIFANIDNLYILTGGITLAHAVLDGINTHNELIILKISSRVREVLPERNNTLSFVGLNDNNN